MPKFGAIPARPCDSLKHMTGKLQHLGSTISIIIPVRDEPQTARAVATVLTQDCLDVVAEILVVGSGIPALPEDARVVRVETNSACLPGANRNRGIERAKGRNLIFLDADCCPRPGWLCALADALESVPVVSGAVALGADGYAATAYNLTTFSLFREGLPKGTRPFLPTLTLGVRREVIDAVGLLDETLARCEDMDWTMRMVAGGFSLAFEPRAVVEHRPTTSLRLALSKWWESGQVSAGVRRRHRRGAGGSSALARCHPLVFGLLSPVLACGATIRVFWSPDSWRHFHTLPLVYATKVAWCLGAARPLGGICQ